MIEELNEYLERHGYSSDIANCISSNYLHYGLLGVSIYARTTWKSENDYEDIFVNDVKKWKIEAGEIDEDHNYWDFIDFQT